MKGITTALVVLALVAAKGAYANNEADGLCTVTQELARSIMIARQLGQPLDKIMKIVEGDEMSQLMVLRAYQRPAFLTEENRRQAAVEFGNEMGVLCYEGMRLRNAG